MPLSTLQIALMGSADEPILVGIRSFPIHKLVLVSLPEDLYRAKRLSSELGEMLKIRTASYMVKNSNVQSMLEIFAHILKSEQSFQDILVNIGSANKPLAYAGVIASCVFGVKVFDVIDGQPDMLPLLKLTYSEMVSQTKIDILRALDSPGGKVESFERLSQISGFGKPLLSYHIQGSEDSRGLLQLGLVEVEREKRGRVDVAITTLGKTLLISLK